jgi:hypothetical protein
MIDRLMEEVDPIHGLLRTPVSSAEWQAFLDLDEKPHMLSAAASAVTEQGRLSATDSHSRGTETQRWPAVTAELIEHDRRGRLLSVSECA